MEPAGRDEDAGSSLLGGASVPSARVRSRPHRDASRSSAQCQPRDVAAPASTADTARQMPAPSAKVLTAGGSHGRHGPGRERDSVGRGRSIVRQRPPWRQRSARAEVSGPDCRPGAMAGSLPRDSRTPAVPRAGQGCPSRPPRRSRRSTGRPEVRREEQSLARCQVPCSAVAQVLVRLVERREWRYVDNADIAGPGE